MKTLKSLLLAGGLVWGVFGGEKLAEVDKKESVQKEEIVEYDLTKPSLTAPKFRGITGIYSNPRGKTGISAEIRSNAFDEGSNLGIVEMELYEDGELIDSKKTGGGTSPHAVFYLKKTTPGKHIHHVVAIDKDGEKGRSKDLKLEFTGKELDLPPEFLGGLGIYLIDSKKLMLNADDSGDNAGIEDLILYEDGKVLDSEFFKTDSYFGDKGRWRGELDLRKLGRKGKHTYFARATDKGGNMTQSKTIRVNYGK